MDCSNDNDSWSWKVEDYTFDKDSAIELSQCMWDNATQEEDLSYMFDDNTPIKACSSVPYHFTHCGYSNKVSQLFRETSSQVKRRRMLHFSNEDSDLAYHCDESYFLKSKERIDAVDVASTEVLEWDANLQGEDISSSGFEGLDQSEGWLAECLNDTDMQIPSDDMYSSCSSGGQNDSSGTSRHESPNAQTNIGSSQVQQQNIRTSRGVIFKGRKSYMTTPTKLASSVAYPFTFIKPSGANGDVTLKEINQRLRTPPPSKAKDDMNLGTSAITGKPVVNKTRIRTDGGKGCITIMRTKG